MTPDFSMKTDLREYREIIHFIYRSRTVRILPTGPKYKHRGKYKSDRYRYNKSGTITRP